MVITIYCTLSLFLLNVHLPHTLRYIFEDKNTQGEREMNNFPSSDHPEYFTKGNVVKCIEGDFLHPSCITPFLNGVPPRRRSVSS